MPLLRPPRPVAPRPPAAGRKITQATKKAAGSRTAKASGGSGTAATPRSVRVKPAMPQTRAKMRPY